MTKYPELSAAHGIEIETSMYNYSYYAVVLHVETKLQEKLDNGYLMFV